MTRMPILGASALALLAATGPALARDPLPPRPPASSFSAHVTNPWFPLVPGSRAVYVGTKDGAPMRDVVVVSHATRTIDGVSCAVVEDRLYLRGKLEERTTDWYSQDAKRNVWYLGEQTAELDRSGKVKSRSGTWLAGRDGAVAGIYMPADPHVGQAYRQEYLKGEAEDHFRVLAVFSGSDATALLTAEWTPLEPGVLDHKLYARGVGIVMEHAERGDTEHSELVSYTVPR
jgi:hypothetical protein